MNLVGHSPIVLRNASDAELHTERRNLAFWLAYSMEDSMFCQWEDTWPTAELPGVDWIGYTLSDTAEKELRGKT